MDSNFQYNYVSDFNQLALELTYRVLSRDNMGNCLISERLVDDAFPLSYANNNLDSNTYFNAENIHTETTWVWNSHEVRWQKEVYVERSLSGILLEFYVKGFRDFYNSYNGDRYLMKQHEDNADTSYKYDYIPESDSWNLKSRSIPSYDELNNDTLEIISSWNGNEWNDSLKNRRVYESYSMILFTSFSFDLSENLWKPLRQVRKHYTNFKIPDTVLYQDWDNAANNWKDNRLVCYSYDNQDREIGSLSMSYSDQTQSLINETRYTVSYATGSETRIDETWDEESQQWMNSLKYYYSYLSDDVLDTFQLDLWDQTILQWEPYNRYSNIYDEHLNLQVHSNYYFVSGDWQLDSRTDYFWSPFIPNAIPEIIANAVDVFPNPASTQVSFILPDGGVFQDKVTLVQVFNLSGQRITEIPIKEGKAVWNSSSVKPGLYVYSTLLNGQKITGRIVVKNK
jgi:hypothetical protein